jgi:hypothetical protein
VWLKKFQTPLETKSYFANSIVAAERWCPGAPWALTVRRAPVVSGAARNHLALWRIWLCALMTSRPCGVRPLASTASLTSLKWPSENGPVRTIIRPPSDIAITAEQNAVTIEGGKSDKTERDFLYRGISNRNFKRQFDLADYVQVKSATFDNGLLKIELVREIPEAMKPRRIAINGGSADNVHKLEAKAA